MNEKPTLREKFHRVGSLLFEITLASGSSKEPLKELVDKCPQHKDSPETKEISKALESIEKTAMRIDVLLSEIKDYVYEKVSPDALM